MEVELGRLPLLRGSILLLGDVLGRVEPARLARGERYLENRASLLGGGRTLVTVEVDVQVFIRFDRLAQIDRTLLLALTAGWKRDLVIGCLQCAPIVPACRIPVRNFVCFRDAIGPGLSCHQSQAGNY